MYYKTLFNFNYNTLSPFLIYFLLKLHTQELGQFLNNSGWSFFCSNKSCFN